MKLLTLTSVVLMGLIINNAIRRSNARSKKINEEFWQRERESYRAPARSIKDLDYVRFPENLPVHISTDDPSIKEYQKTLENLTKEEVLNLSGISNTDIRMSYGNKNMEELSRADQRYLTLCRTLDRLSEAYVEKGFRDEARTLLEFALSVGSDISGCWIRLGHIYLENEDREALLSLIGRAEALTEDTHSRNEILKSLNELKILMDIIS